MPRLGRHPLKERSIKERVLTPNKITITTIVYIPTESGYWEHSFMNLKLFFQSLVSNTTGEYDLMVFDNGSCKKIIDYLNNLKLNGIIDFLILSTHEIICEQYVENSSPNVIGVASCV